MIYLGNPSGEKVRRAMRAGVLGMMATPAAGNTPEGIPVWAADNGAFGKAGYPGDERYLDWLARWWEHRRRCLFATAPDVVGDAAGTLERGRHLLPSIRALGYPAAFVVQNGADRVGVPWAEFDALFVGGSPECARCAYIRPAREFDRKTCPTCGGRLQEWKLGLEASYLCRQAKAHGKHVHVGRVNSARRWRRFLALDCAHTGAPIVDSVDGTFVAVAPDKNLKRMRAWQPERVQGVLELLPSALPWRTPPPLPVESPPLDEDVPLPLAVSA